MNLLVDIGNSRLKWALAGDGIVGEPNYLDYRRPDAMTDLMESWRQLAAPEKIALASVSDRSLLDDVVRLIEILWPALTPLIPKSSRQAFGVTSAYDRPEMLGVDRWLALVASHRLYKGGVCLVDCGTAVTVDVLAADGMHRGGLIVPGLRMMQKSLASGTAGLPYDERVSQMNLAAETGAGIANGALLAVTGLIENAVRRFAADYRLILTGGDADVVAGGLAVPAIIERKLVLNGLAVFCDGKQNP